MAVNGALLLKIAPTKFSDFVERDVVIFFFNKRQHFPLKHPPFPSSPLSCFLTRVAQAVLPELGNKPIPILTSSVIAHTYLKLHSNSSSLICSLPVGKE